MRLSILLLVVAWLMPGVSQAESLGVSLYERGEYAKARQALERELRSTKLTSQAEATALLYLAASLHELGEGALARARLEQLVLGYPEHEVEQGLFPPDFMAMVAEVRTRVAAERAPPPPVPDRTEDRTPSPEDPFAQDEEPAAAGRSRLLPEVFGFLDPVGKAVGVGGGVTYGSGSFEVGARVLLGDQLGAGAQVGLVLGDGAFRPHLALRGTAIPGLSAYGGGPVVGVRLALGSSLTALVDVGAELFKVSDEGYRSFVLTTSVGLGFDLLSP